MQALAASLRIELLYLPSYSPNLNLIERLWKFVKKECLSCRVLPTYEAFTQSIDNCLAELDTRHKHQMDTLLSLEFQLFDEDVPVQPFQGCELMYILHLAPLSCPARSYGKSETPEADLADTHSMIVVSTNCFH